MARFCANCGAQMDDNAPFCPNCGAKQEIPQQAAPQQAKAKNLNVKLPGIEGDPITAAKKGNKTIFAYGVLIFGFLTFLFNLFPIIKFKAKVSLFGMTQSDKHTSALFGAAKDLEKGGIIAIRVIGIIILLGALGWLGFRLFTGKLTDMELYLACGALVLFFIINIISYAVLSGAYKGHMKALMGGDFGDYSSAVKLSAGPNFGGVLMFIFNILGIGCAACPTVLKLVGGKK